MAGGWTRDGAVDEDERLIAGRSVGLHGCFRCDH